MDTIDLRSDTVSHPTPTMRQAMAEANVGDDVFGDDPTVIELQDYAAQLLGKEAALFCASGTQGNVISVLTHFMGGSAVRVFFSVLTSTSNWRFSPSIRSLPSVVCSGFSFPG